MLNILANSLVPVVAGLLLGYAAGLRNLVDNKDLRTLTTFVMSFAAPCALFTTIVRAPHPLLWGQSKVALVLAAVYLTIYALMYFSARRIGKLTTADSSVLSLTLAFPNAAAIGVPLIPAVYGNGSAVSVAVAIAVGAATISPITLTILESNTRDRDHPSSLARLRVSLWSAIRRPVVWAPILGVLLVAVNLVVPSYVDKSLSIYGTAIAATALFLTGLVVSAQRFNLSWSVGWSVLGKTLLQPALCLGVARVVGLPLEQTRDVVLISAIPCGFFGVVFGKSFDATPAVASSSLIASTVVGIFTLAGWIVLLSHLHL
ncbi:MAG TPA: AEC family transporter [Steroidobacteraceae bacterium]